MTGDVRTALPCYLSIDRTDTVCMYTSYGIDTDYTVSFEFVPVAVPVAVQGYRFTARRYSGKEVALPVRGIAVPATA